MRYFGMVYRSTAYQWLLAEFKRSHLSSVAASHGAVALGILQTPDPLAGAFDLLCSPACDMLLDDPRFEEI
jgi:hypothetical protein